MCGENLQTHSVDLEPTGPNVPNTNAKADVDGQIQQLEEMLTVRHTHKAHSVQEKPTSDRQARPTACLWYPQRSPTDSIVRIPRPTVTLTLSSPQIVYAAATVYKTVVVAMEWCEM